MFEKGLNVPEVASISGHKRLVSCLGMFKLMLGYKPKYLYPQTFINIHF